jgi:hypothetical protein
MNTTETEKTTKINIQNIPGATRDLLLSYLVKVENHPYVLIKNELSVMVTADDLRLILTRYSEFLSSLCNLQMTGLSYEDFNRSTK